MHIIAGFYKGQKLSAPKGQNTRPTSSRLREALFNICQYSIEQADCLDLFAGSGALGFEALSRGAVSCTFIDKNPSSIASIKKNAQQFKALERVKILKGDLFLQLNKIKVSGKCFDLIFADPPYEQEIEGELLSVKLIYYLDRSNFLAPGGSLFVEEGKDISALLKDLVNLKLKGLRKVGRSYLFEFFFPSDQDDVS